MGGLTVVGGKTVISATVVRCFGPVDEAVFGVVATSCTVRSFLFTVTASLYKIIYPADKRR